MRIALEFSGQQRSVAAGFEYYKKNLFDEYPGQVDVFFHTWKDTNNDDAQYYYGNYTKSCNITDNHFSRNLLEKKYPNIANPQFPAYNTVSMFYSMFIANALRKNYEQLKEIQYDVVIRSRFDYALNINLNDKFQQSILHPDVVYVPNDRMNTAHTFCADMFAFGSPKVMDLYCNTYPNLDFYYDHGTVMNGEDMLSMNLNIYGLAGNRMQYMNMNNPFPSGKFNFNRHSFLRDDFTKFNNLRG